MNYYRWTFDSSVEALIVSEPIDDSGARIWATRFRECREFPLRNLRADVKYAGLFQNAAFGAFDILYVSSSTKELISSFDAPVQFIPVDVGEPVEKLLILNVIAQVDCVDESRSVFTKFEVNDAVRPDLAGEYSGFLEFKIRASENYPHIFRPKHWPIIIVISDTLRSSLVLLGVSGTSFELVS